MGRLDHLRLSDIRRPLGGAGVWIAVVAIAALFTGWELTTHFPAHRIIASNRVAFVLTAVAVGLAGSGFARYAFTYLDRAQRDLSRQDEAGEARSVPSPAPDAGALVQERELAPSVPPAAAIARLR